MATSELLRDFLRFARGRALVTASLIIVGSLLESAGVLLLIPILQTLLSDNGSVGDLPDRLMNAIGLETAGERIAVLLLAFAVLAALRFIVNLRRAVETARLRTGFVVHLRSRSFSSLASVPWSDLSGRGHNRIGHALARDIDRVSDAVGVVLSGGLAILQIAVQLTVSLLLAPIITMGVVLFGSGAFMALRRLRRRAARQGADLTDADYQLYYQATSYIRAIKQARAHGLEASYADAFSRAAGRVGRELLRQERDYTLSALLMQSAVAVLGLAAVAAGVFLVPVSPERLIVVILILGRLAHPAQSIQLAIQQIGYAAAAYESVRRLVSEGGVPAAPPVARRLDRAPEIAFRDVSYSSAEAELVARIDCTIKAGGFVAVIGHSGAGKSIFCDLAVGLLEPQSGRVELDGQPLSGEVLARLRQSLAYVGQDPVVFEDSLRANLTAGCSAVSDEEIWRALEVVGAAGLARNLAGGLEGSMRAGGSRFSGGERQRFRLAHALLRRPKMIVLDEATNALDESAERAVLQGFRQAAPDATLLSVTHRLSSVAAADHLIILDRGRLAWTGPPAEAPLTQRLRI